MMMLSMQAKSYCQRHHTILTTDVNSSRKLKTPLMILDCPRGLGIFEILL